MKATKKFVAGALATAMALAVNVPAFAANITINNAAAGETYTAYKLFDMTQSGTGAQAKYSYYIENTPDNQSLITLLDSTIGLKLTLSADGSRYNVNTETEGTGDAQKVYFLADNGKGGEDTRFDAAELAQALNTNKSGLPASTLTGTDEDENGTVTISTQETGYYFIDSTLGALCALYTNEDNATVNEKNTVPSINKKVWEDSANNGQGGVGAYVDDPDFATIDVTDTIKYQLTVNTGSNASSTGTGIDDDFVITDELPDGITYKANSVAITGGNWDKDTDYTVVYDEDGNTLTITLLSTGELGTLGQNANITITYDATAAADLATREAHTNTVILNYKNQTSQDTANVKTYEIGEDANGNPTITKVDGDNTATKLEGVKFVLQNNTTDKYATFNTSGCLTGWVENIQDSCKLTTDESGNIKAYGLDADTYTLTEIETLPGYNLLDGTVTVVIKNDGDVTYDLTTDEDPAGSTITIKNTAGTLLPSTGGMGTTVLYIAGIVLVLGAGVTLVVRRRMNQDR